MVSLVVVLSSQYGHYINVSLWAFIQHSTVPGNGISLGNIWTAFWYLSCSCITSHTMGYANMGWITHNGSCCCSCLGTASCFSDTGWLGPWPAFKIITQQSGPAPLLGSAIALAQTISHTLLCPPLLWVALLGFSHAHNNHCWVHTISSHICIGLSSLSLSHNDGLHYHCCTLPGLALDDQPVTALQ